MISSEVSLRDILPNEAPPKGSVYEIVQKIENFGTQNGGDAIQERKNPIGKELGSKVSSTVVSPTKKITTLKNSHATMNIQSDQEIGKAHVSDFPLIVEPKEVPIFENNFKRNPKDRESSKPRIDLICPARIKYGSKEVIIKDGKAIDIDGNHCCAVQKHQKGLFALASHQCVSTFEKYCSSMKKCFKKVVKKAKLKNKELRHLKKRLNQSGGDHPVRSGDNKIEVTNLQVQRNTQLRICTHLDDVTEACSTEEESHLRHYIPKCRRDCQRRHKRISRKQLSYTPVYVLSSDESLGNETSSMEDTSSRAVHSLAPGIFESEVGCVCGHSRKYKKSIKRTRDSPGLYLVRIPDSDSESVLCLNNERNICSRKIRHTKNYIMKQFKSHSSSFKMPGSWAKKIKKKPKIEDDSDDFYCDDEHIVIKKPIRRTSKCLICKDCVKNSKEKHYLNDPYVYSVTGINSVDAKREPNVKSLSSEKSRSSKSLKSSKKSEYLYHSIKCRCAECKARVYEKLTPNKGSFRKHCDENRGSLCKNCYDSCKTKSRENSKASRKCEKCRCYENQVKKDKEFDFNGTDLHKIVYARKHSLDNSSKSTAKTSKSDVVLSKKKDDSNIVLCEYVHGSEIRSEVNLAHCSNENIDDLECSASLTACAMCQKEKHLCEMVQTKPSTSKVGANSSKSIILKKNHSSEDLTCTNLQILTQIPHYDTT